MIGNIDLNNKTYEQIMEESIAQIPIYSSDWTNYNVSDPGVTILENLSAFLALLESEINEVPENIKLKLLGLVGFKPQKGKTAYAYIEAVEDNSDKVSYFPKGTKLYAQDICFEFENESGKYIRNIKFKDINADKNLLRHEGIKGGVYLDDFTLYLNDIPDIGDNCAIYFEMEKIYGRNNFSIGEENPFAKVKWEINTDEGYEKLKVKDDTHCFMESGYVKFALDEKLHRKAKNAGEYAIRVSFENSDYDIRPKFKRILGILTRVVQKDTKSRVESNNSVVMDESVMAYRSLGRLLGYDNQVFELPPFERVYGEGFSILVAMKNTDNVEVCHLAYPDTEIEGEVNYSVQEESNTIIIHDCGKYEGADVRLGDYCIYMGDKADMLPDTILTIKDSNVKFVNYGPGEKGYYTENFEEVRKRFVKDIKTPVTMVTKDDCIKVVSSIPALSIDKIGICADNVKNVIHVVVKPNSTERFPILSKAYMDIINNYLEQYRMLTTSIIVEQPQYVPINVNGIIYTKKHLKNSRDNIENALEESLDSTRKDIVFGSRIVYHEIFKKIEMLECVTQIASLSIYPEDYRFVEVLGLDIKLSSNALYYAGNINIEIIEI